MKSIAAVKKSGAYTRYIMPVILFIGIVVFHSCKEKNNRKQPTTAIMQLTGATPTDAEFIVSAAKSNWIEIQFAQLAQTNAQTEEVKALGKIAEERHAGFLKELQQLATKKNIELPATTLPDSILETYKSFLHKTGTDFDTAYCNMMVNGYRDVINYFEKATVSATGYDTRYWARNILPSLKTNLDYALACQKKFSTRSKVASYQGPQ